MCRSYFLQCFVFSFRFAFVYLDLNCCLALTSLKVNYIEFLLLCFFVQYEVDLIKLMRLHVFMDLVHLLCLSLPCINDFTLDKELITVNLL